MKIVADLEALLHSCWTHTKKSLQQIVIYILIGERVQTHLIGKHEQRVLGVEEGLISQQEGRVARVAAAAALLAGTGVHQRVMHGGVVMRATRPAPISRQAALSRHPVQVPASAHDLPFQPCPSIQMGSWHHVDSCPLHRGHAHNNTSDNFPGSLYTHAVLQRMREGPVNMQHQMLFKHLTLSFKVDPLLHQHECITSLWGVMLSEGLRVKGTRHAACRVAGKVTELPALVALHHWEIVHQGHDRLCIWRQVQVS